MPPPHLHPRSTATSVLFGGTLLASFVVVAVPHIWPCPRPRGAYLDSEVIFDDQGRPMRRVRKVKKTADGAEAEQESTNIGQRAHSIAHTAHTSMNRKGNTMQEEAEMLRQLQAEAAAHEDAKARRPCPVPKPKGVVGRLLGFEEKVDNSDGS